MSDIDTSTKYEDFCPLTGQFHRYFLFKTFETYERYKVIDGTNIDSDAARHILAFIGSHELYEKKEYAVLSCNCSSVIKQEIQKGY
jgi:hypothetical protein